MAKSKAGELAGHIADEIEDAIRAIAELSRSIPGLRRHAAGFRRIEDGLSAAPDKAAYSVDEAFTDQLHDTDIALGGLLGQIGPEVERIEPVISSSGTAVEPRYYRMVQDVAQLLPSDPEVQYWAASQIQIRDEIRQRQNKSDVVNRRLGQLQEELAVRYRRGRERADFYTSGASDPDGAAEDLRWVLRQFKGELLDLCDDKRGSNFRTISRNLAFENGISEKVVADEGDNWSALRVRLGKIAKGDANTTAAEMRELLVRTEDLIMTVTEALDPAKIGIVFYGPED